MVGLVPGRLLKTTDNRQLEDGTNKPRESPPRGLLWTDQRRQTVTSSLAQLVGKKIESYPLGRVCDEEGCQTKLSVYNPEEHCNVHWQPRQKDLDMSEQSTKEVRSSRRKRLPKEASFEEVCRAYAGKPGTGHITAHRQRGQTPCEQSRVDSRAYHKRWNHERKVGGDKNSGGADG